MFSEFIVTFYKTLITGSTVKGVYIYIHQHLQIVSPLCGTALYSVESRGLLSRKITR